MGDIEGKYATQIPVPPALTTSLKDIFIRPHTNAKYECFTKEQIKANIKSNVINYNCKLHFNEKPENELPVISLGRHYQSFFTEWKKRS